MIGIEIKRQSRDDGFDSYRALLSDDQCSFNVSMYIAHSSIAALKKQLSDFDVLQCDHDVEFQLGNFDVNVAGGGIRVKISPREKGRIFLKIFAQSEWFEFNGESVKKVSSMYLVTEPVLIDHFISSLNSLHRYETDISILEADDLHSSW